jgi:hypothetical protein
MRKEEIAPKYVTFSSADSSVLNVEQAIKVIKKLGDEFSSRDFISEYSYQYESEYINSLYKYKGENAFRTVHQQIGAFLDSKMNELHIKKSIQSKTLKNENNKIVMGRIFSKNIFGHLTDIQFWEKLD